MDINWDEAPCEATHWDSEWGAWMWLDSDGDWLKYGCNAISEGWSIVFCSKSTVDDYFVERSES